MGDEVVNIVPSGNHDRESDIAAIYACKQSFRKFTNLSLAMRPDYQYEMLS